VEPIQASDPRLFEVVEVIQALARLEFTVKAQVGSEGDLFDALGAGVNMLGEELAAYARQVEERADALALANAELTRRALFDPLTGLPNRVLLREGLVEALARLEPGVGAVALMTIDLDGFKAVNDSLGYATGDRMLIEVAGRLSSTSGARHTVGRLDGDEFCALLTSATEADAQALARDLAARLAEPFDVDGQVVRLVASIGIAMGQAGDDPDDLMRNANIALYSSKSARSSTVQIYAEGMQDPIARRLRLSSALREAVDHDALTLAYQPIVDLRTRSIVGFEALARWHDPELGTVPPSVFIPLAEQIGVMPRLGEWVLATASAEAARWQGVRADGLRPYVAVNVSAVQLRTEGLAERVAKLLERAGLAPDLLLLEVTESQLVEHIADAVGVLRELRQLGVRVAIDDFGTGYSSLSYLRNLPVDVVKIDRSFISGIGTTAGEWSFAQAMVRLIQRLGLTTVAEGVEDAAQLAHARAIGVEMAQGYYFGRPGGADSAMLLLREGRPGERQQGEPEVTNPQPTPDHSVDTPAGAGR
jgi:diguanylate cyclase (GGDEF)-like protein